MTAGDAGLNAPMTAEPPYSRTRVCLAL